MFPVLLQTPRLVLRPFAPGDEPAFAAYRSDPHVARYQSWDAPYPLADACQDHQISLAIGEAIRTGSSVTTSHEGWSDPA